MLTSLHIQNFRAFSDLKVEGLGRINLLVGGNNSGKTTLLEALYLLSDEGKAEHALSPYVAREVRESGDKNDALYEIAWNNFFHRLNPDATICVRAEHEKHGRLALRISTEHLADIRVDIGKISRPATEVLKQPPRIFRYRVNEDEEIRSHMYTLEGAIHVSRNKDLSKINSSSFAVSMLLQQAPNIRPYVELLSKLRLDKAHDVVEDAVRIIEPKLKDLDIGTIGGLPMIYGDIGLPKLVPLPTMGEGIIRLAHMALHISEVPGGVVLIDEIETGIHHSALVKTWQTVDKLARKFNTQVFATTHSFECVEAAHEALGQDGFVLHRVEVDPECRCVSYGAGEIEAVIKHGFEVR